MAVEAVSRGAGAGATAATVNLAHVVAAVEFIDIAPVEPTDEGAVLTAAEVVAELGRVTADLSEPGDLRRE